MSAWSKAVAAAFLVVVHIVAIFPGFFAPFDYEEQHRSFAYSPPSQVRLSWGNGGPTLTCSTENVAAPSIHFFAQGSRYVLLLGGLGSWTASRHLFVSGSEPPCFLLGTDAYGRDQFSRLLYASRISMFAGLFAALVSLSLGATLGAAAGYWGEWIDHIISRLIELSLAVPVLYSLLIARAVLPLRMGAGQVFFCIIGLVGVAGWARPARLVRGLVFSARERDFVKAARGFGASDLYILRRHIFPQIRNLLLTQLSVLIPQYILIEVALSFLGLGVNEPVPSWGNMLTPLQQFAVLNSCWWMFAPALFAIPVAFAYYVLAGERS
jgi:peptide/nickel transport system permease protein